MKAVLQREDYAIILLPGRRMKLVDVSAYKPNEDVKYLGKLYDLDPKRRRRLVGWRPRKGDWFFSDMLVRDGIRRTVAIYPVSNAPGVVGPIQALDRLTQDLPADALTPQIHRTYFISPLYRSRMRKMRISGIDLRVMILVFGLLGVIMFLLYISGYLGG